MKFDNNNAETFPLEYYLRCFFTVLFQFCRGFISKVPATSAQQSRYNNKNFSCKGTVAFGRTQQGKGEGGVLEQASSAQMAEAITLFVPKLVTLL